MLVNVDPAVFLTYKTQMTYGDQVGWADLIRAAVYEEDVEMFDEVAKVGPLSSPPLSCTDESILVLRRISRRGTASGYFDPRRCTISGLADDARGEGLSLSSSSTSLILMSSSRNASEPSAMA